MREGDEIEFAIDEGGDVSVRGYIAIPADQAWFFTREWQAGEREADEQIARGEGMFFENHEAFVANLKSIIDKGADGDS